MHSDKAKIVYCKDSNRRKEYPNTSFDFLGYTFRPRPCKNKKCKIFTNFTPAVSKAAKKSMCAKVKKSNIRNRTDLSLNEIAKRYNPVLQGRLNYYGVYTRSELYRVWRHFNKTLVAWAMSKYKKLRKRKTKAAIMI